MQPPEVVRQAVQGVAAEVEHLQGVGQLEDFPGELAQAAGQVQARGAGQFAAAQLLQGVHGSTASGQGGWKAAHDSQGVAERAPSPC